MYTLSSASEALYFDLSAPTLFSFSRHSSMLFPRFVLQVLLNVPQQGQEARSLFCRHSVGPQLGPPWMWKHRAHFHSVCAYAFEDSRLKNQSVTINLGKMLLANWLTGTLIYLLLCCIASEQ